MGNPRSYQTQGVVLRQSKLGEFDKIITIFAPEFGKLRAVAKGACRPKSKLGGNVEPLTHSLMFLARGRNLDIVTQSQTINGFPSLKSDLRRLARALYVLDLVDSFTTEGGENHPLFDLLLETLDRLGQPETTDTALRYFELHLLHHLGYRPQLRRCVSCNSPLEPVANFLCPGKGGVLCPGCNSDENRQYERSEVPLLRISSPLSVEALKVLRLWQSCDYATAQRVRLKPDLSRELERTMQEYIRHFLQRELKSLTWLRQVDKEAGTM